VGGEGEGEGDEVVLVSAASSTKKADLASGLHTVEEMEASGRAYRNISQLLVDRAVLDRADGIAVRVRDDFPLASDTWSRWTNATEKYKETSLTQVMSEYFKDHSIGDCGGSGDDYTPLPGYPGTLAPGTQFDELHSLDKLSRKILHPWPAMQAYQWHVRQPQAHPMIAPPLLWFALNDMYTANFTATQLEQNGDSDVIVGGSNMVRTFYSFTQHHSTTFSTQNTYTNTRTKTITKYLDHQEPGGCDPHRTVSESGSRVRPRHPGSSRGHDLHGWARHP
jgi:hypothetical protein